MKLLHKSPIQYLYFSVVLNSIKIILIYGKNAKMPRIKRAKRSGSMLMGSSNEQTGMPEESDTV
jgi:hypothetical protein